MVRIGNGSWVVGLACLVLASLAAGARGEMPALEAWVSLPGYQYGDDMAPLLALDRAMIEAMDSAEERTAFAARLAQILRASESTPAAKQYACLKLAHVGTAAEVPLLAQLLRDAETSQWACFALEGMRGDEPASALRNALDSLDGAQLVGVIQSLGTRADVGSVSKLKRVAESEEGDVARAALWALGKIATESARDFLLERAKGAPSPTPTYLSVPLLRCANAAAARGEADEARAVYAFLSEPGQKESTRAAALSGLLALGGEPEVIREWLASEDAARREVAAGRLDTLSNTAITALLGRLTEMPEGAKLALVSVAAKRRGEGVLPIAKSLIAKADPKLQRAGIECLAMLGDSSAIPALIAKLKGEEEVKSAAQSALAQLPRKEVTEALIAALDADAEVRPAIIGVLVDLKCYEAIEPLIEIASDSRPDAYGPALEGLGGIADPDKHDLPRLIKLLLESEAGRHQDDVERVIVRVCEKASQRDEARGLVHAALKDVGTDQMVKYLPLLGRVGGERSREVIDKARRSEDPRVREAAVRALCNWPNNDLSDDLWELAAESENAAWRRWALRAYIRVITLPSDRVDSKTLEMLQEAAGLAEWKEDVRLAVERASVIRTMDAVRWIAGYLDEPEVCQSACKSLVELAHHRFLRHPNLAEFRPVLEKVARVSEDPEVVDRARRYQLGL